jgi:hypothetical protein
MNLRLRFGNVARAEHGQYRYAVASAHRTGQCRGQSWITNANLYCDPSIKGREYPASVLSHNPAIKFP